MSIDKKFGPYIFSVHLFGFKCKDSSLSKTFLFICQNRAAHKNIKLKLIKKFEPYFFVRLCVFKCKDSTLSKERYGSNFFIKCHFDVKMRGAKKHNFDK